MNSSFENQLIYEDSEILVINKQAGQVVQPDKQQSVSLLDNAKTYLKEKNGRNTFCEIVHRLDRVVSGVLVFAKTKLSLADLNNQFKSNCVQKTYWAIVSQKPSATNGELIDFLIKNEKHNKSFVTQENTMGAVQAKLHYQLIAQSDRYFLLEINLETGRHHQIRVQLSNMGCCIKGDLKYGNKRSNKDGSISLHSKKITFTHPTKKEKMTFLAETPNDSLWNYFAKAVMPDRTNGNCAICNEIQIF